MRISAAGSRNVVAVDIGADSVIKRAFLLPDVFKMVWTAKNAEFHRTPLTSRFTAGLLDSLGSQSIVKLKIEISHDHISRGRIRRPNFREKRIESIIV